MKKLLALLLVLVSALALVACNGTPSGTIIKTAEVFNDYLDGYLPFGNFSYEFKIKHEENIKTVNEEEKNTLSASGIWNYVEDNVLKSAKYDITLKTVEKVATLNGKSKSTATAKEKVVLILNDKTYDKYFDVSIKTKKSNDIDAKYQVKTMDGGSSTVSIENYVSFTSIISLIKNSYENGVAFLKGSKLTVIESTKSEHTEIVINISKGKIKTIKVETKTAYGKSMLDIKLTKEKTITEPKDKAEYVGYNSL